MLEKEYRSLENERLTQELWEKEGIYRFDPKKAGEIYSIDTPPPTVSGSLHIGHIFSYTQAEMVARFHRMQGRNVFYPFGFDDNGLPTERLVEKEEGILARDLRRSAFIEKCMATAAKYEGQFRELWKSLGFSVDWKLQYETVSTRSQRISQRSFLELAEKGKAYMKESPVLWCTVCMTSIAQAELDSTEKETTFNRIPFTIGDRVVEVATTRPELLYGCVALFVHPEDERYRGLEGKEAEVPLYGFKVPVLTDEKVQREKGTGAVMCCTFGDTVDLEWVKTYNLPYKKVILPDGTLESSIPEIGGLKVEKARKAILAILAERGLLQSSEVLLHSVSVHERCGKEVEMIPSRQWYIDILTEKERYLHAADDINWYPAYMKERYETWVRNLKWDWCISRQRYFGIPFPVWYCKSCGSIILAEKEDLPVNPLEKLPGKPCKCGSMEFIPEEAVLDTWATSSLTPQINAGWGEERDICAQLLPMSMRTQAHEIIRTWAFYTIVKSLYHTGKIPWKDIMICGFVLAKKGEKFSKSKNNATLSPAQLVETYSADAVRYWAAGAKLGTDTLFSEEELKTSRRFLTKLWNASRFSLLHLQDYDGEATEKLMPVDRWILEKMKQTQTRAANLLLQYEVGDARREMDEFFWKDYCDNYLELVKERLYQPELHGKENRRSAQFAVYHTLLGILKMYAVYVPHMTEIIYQGYYRNIEGTVSLHQLLWHCTKNVEEGLLQLGEDLQTVLAEVRKFKSARNLSMKAPVGSLAITLPESRAGLFSSAEKDLAACTSAVELRIRAGEECGIEIEE